MKKPDRKNDAFGKFSIGSHRRWEEVVNIGQWALAGSSPGAFRESGEV